MTEMSMRRTARCGDMVLHGEAVVSDANGPSRLTMRVDGLYQPVVLDTTRWKVALEDAEPETRTSDPGSIHLALRALANVDMNESTTEGMVTFLTERGFRESAAVRAVELKRNPHLMSAPSGPDPEVAAMQAVLETLVPLTDTERQRVLRWITCRLDGREL